MNQTAFSIIVDILLIGCLIFANIQNNKLESQLEKTQSALTECTQKGVNFNEE